MLLSFDPLQIKRSFASLKEMIALTCPVWPTNVSMQVPFRISQILIVLSVEPLAK